MKIDKVTAVYFSPTGGTRKYVTELARALQADFAEIDLTNPAVRARQYQFGKNDLVIFGAPVYAGRLPQIENGIFNRIAGTETPAVFNISYGNREFEDALLEEKDVCEGRGFVGIAAAAWIAPHTFSAKIAAGRPNQADYVQLATFTTAIKSLLEQDNAIPALTVPGNRPYRNAGAMSFYPSGSGACVACGLCASVCPVGAISREQPRITETEKCIDCFACVKGCPVQARNAVGPAFDALVNRLEGNLLKREKAAELFLP